MIKNISFILLVLLTCNIVYARYRTPNEAPYTIEIDNYNLEIKEDGSYSYVRELQYLINNETGRESLSTYVMNFCGNSTFKILEAKTIIEDQVHIVPLNEIEIKPVASSYQGFDQISQALVAFKKAVVGARLYIRTEQIVSNIPIKNHYSTLWLFGYGSHTLNSNYQIISHIPNLRLDVKDKHNKLIVEEKLEDKLKKITIKLKEPVYFDIANETSISTLNLDDIPTVEISTLTSFEQMADGILQPYENTINDKMPSSFALIAKNAAKIKDDYDKVNFVTSSINDQIRYMGSWQTINGKIYPRSMDIIAQSGYADCKEYSVILAAILRKLGFKAHVALALRSYEPYMNRYKLPGMHLFNHVIVYAQSKSGIKLWIDPTNFISDAKDIFFDVSNRFCLILDPSNARLEKSPESKIQEIDIKKTTTYQDQYTAYTNGITSFKNSAAYKGIGAEMRTSRELVINGYVDYFCYDADKSEDYHVDFPILNTRIAKNFEVKDKYKIASPILLTNLGDGIKSHSFTWLIDYNVFLNVTKDFKGIMYLGPKIQFKYRHVYKNIKADNLEKLSFSMSNKWFNYSRKFSYINQDVILEEYFKMLENYVDPQENITELMSIRSELSNNLSKNIFIKSSSGSKSSELNR